MSRLADNEMTGGSEMRGKVQTDEDRDEKAEWERLTGEELEAEYRHLDAHLTAELCKLSLHLQNFVERRVVAEAIDRITPRSEEGFRLGDRLMQVGSALMVDARRRG